MIKTINQAWVGIYIKDDAFPYYRLRTARPLSKTLYVVFSYSYPVAIQTSFFLFQNHKDLLFNKAFFVLISFKLIKSFLSYVWIKK